MSIAGGKCLSSFILAYRNPIIPAAFVENSIHICPWCIFPYFKLLYFISVKKYNNFKGILDKEYKWAVGIDVVYNRD